MKVNFYTPTFLSELDLTSMGGSEKRDDVSKIGTYCSGLKYAIAILLRNSVKFTAVVNNQEKIIYSLGTYLSKDESTGKEKELLTILKNEDLKLKTGFSVDLGFDWELWMALREIYSNMVDEEGYYTEGEPDEDFKGTVITLEFEENSDFEAIWNNRGQYFNENTPLKSFKYGSRQLDLLDNPDKYLKIYKQNILVYEERERPSYYAFNINFGKIDEMRVLSNTYSVLGDILTTMTEDGSELSVGFLLDLPEEASKCKVFGSDAISSWSLSTRLKEKVEELGGNISTFMPILETLKKVEGTPLAGRKLTTLKESVYSAQKEVVIEETVETIINLKEDLSITEKITQMYDLEIGCAIKIVNITGSKVVADKFNGILLVDESFDLESDMLELLIQLVDLEDEGRGNIIYKLAKKLLNKLKK